ncbi:MAG: hypothetical protein CVU57_23520 [Deltaproteobacteria bacterium HGW-Deltaproteobacteria-15]|nr:MAG: hypothetical protein CVU57_23520 [Deltaproteobacteria bacterium HGW-Deltaproteobacteria-15]
MDLKEIREEEARERKDTFKETRDIKKEERDRTVEDKEAIRGLASQLEFSGFSEAGENIRQEVASAGESTDQRFEEQDQDATENVFSPQKEHEKELTERSEGISKDMDRISSERLVTDTAQDRLNEAKSSAERGKEQVEEVRDEQEREREEGEVERDEQKRRKDDTKIEFNT